MPDAGCRLWLQAASRCESPAAEWPARIAALAGADEYGAREELLRSANLLLSEPALRALVASYEAELDDALAQPRPAGERVNWPAGKASAALSLLSEALRDADVLVRATLKRTPSPNVVQVERFVRAFLDYGHPEGALPWLEGQWAHMEGSRQRLQAQALTTLGRTDEAAAIRQRIFEATLAVSDLHDWLDLLPPRQHADAMAQARSLAAGRDDPVVVARLLMDIGDEAAAEVALLADPGRIDGGDYSTLAHIPHMLRRNNSQLPATSR